MAPKRKPKISLPEHVRKAFVEFGRIGGQLGKGGRWRKLTPEQRTELGRRLAQARWKGRKKTS